MKKYPVNLKIEYSEKSNKSTALFRLVLIIPIILILALLGWFNLNINFGIIAITLAGFFASIASNFLKIYFYK